MAFFPNDVYFYLKKTFIFCLKIMAKKFDKSSFFKLHKYGLVFVTKKVTKEVWFS